MESSENKIAAPVILSENKVKQRSDADTGAVCTSQLKPGDLPSSPLISASITETGKSQDIESPPSLLNHFLEKERPWKGGDNDLFVSKSSKSALTN